MKHEGMIYVLVFLMGILWGVLIMAITYAQFIMPEAIEKSKAEAYLYGMVRVGHILEIPVYDERRAEIDRVCDSLKIVMEIEP